MRTFGNKWRDVVISESDIEFALDHLRKLPYRPTLPVTWDRQRLLGQIRESIGETPKINECHSIAPGVFAITKEFGVDLVSQSDYDERLQIWLMIRPSGTDPTRITEL